MVCCEVLKGVRCNLPVILLEDRGSDRESPLQEGIDAIVSASSPTELYNKIEELVKKAESAA